MTSPDPEVLYIALVNDSKRRAALHQLTYRCAHDDRCLLLDALEIPGPERVLLHQKRFKNSDEVNRRRSSEAGRRANTVDGDRHWKPRTYYIGQSALDYPDDRPTPRLSVQCDHVGVLPDGSDCTLLATDFHADWQAGHSEVRMRADGTRFAVR